MNNLMVFVCIILMQFQNIETNDGYSIPQYVVPGAVFVGSVIGGCYIAHYLSSSGIPEHHKWDYAWDGSNSKEITSALKNDSIFVGMPWLIRRNILNVVSQLNSTMFCAQSLVNHVFNAEKSLCIGYLKYSTPYCEYSVQQYALSRKLIIEIKSKK